MELAVRGKFEGAGFAGNAVEEAVVRGAGEVGIALGGERDDAQAETFQERHEPQDFFGLAAVAKENRKIALGAEPEITVERLRGVDKTRGDAGAVEGRSDFLSDVSGFADAAEDQFATGGDRGLDGTSGGDKFSV